MNIRLVFIYEDNSGFEGALNTINNGKAPEPLALAGAPDIPVDMSTSYVVVNVAKT